MAGNATIQQYLTELNLVAERCVQLHQYQEIQSLIQQITQFFRKHKAKQLVVEVLYNEFCARLETFIEFYNQVIRLNSLLGDVSLELALHDAISKFENVIIVCGHNHAVHANQLLRRFGNVYAMPIADGLDMMSLDDFKGRAISICGIPVLQSTFDPLLSAAKGAVVEEKRCLSCGIQQEKLLRCAKCKWAKYCSAACQKAHWQQHKKECAAPKK